MSSPFHPSHRRTRSYSSLSSPSTSPAPQQFQWRSPPHRAHACPKTLPCDVHGTNTPCPSAHKGALDLTVRPPEKWDVDRWRRGKRARCEPESPSGDADMESGDEAVASSPSPGYDRPIADSAWSNSTKLPSTSDAFQFSTRAKGPNRTYNTSKQPLDAMDGIQFAPQTDRLARMQSAAFSDLRKSVEEAGEGFVRRMREFEAQRSLAGPAVVHYSNQHVFHKRGRKRPSPRASRLSTLPSVSTEQEPTDNIDDEHGGEESDVEILSSIASSSDDYPHPSPTKKRAVSLCALNDIPYASQPQSSMSSPVRPTGGMFRRTRSPSPMEISRRGMSLVHSNSNSSDEEDELHFDAQRPRRARKVRRPRYSCDASSAESTAPSLSFSFASANSSMQSLALGKPTSAGRTPVPMNDGGDEYIYPSFPNAYPHRPTVPEKSSKYTEKAVAALSLALANGAGSVTEYETLQKTCNSVFPTDDSEAGNLWH